MDETSQEEWLEGYHEWKGKSKKERCPHNCLIALYLPMLG